MRYEVVNCFQIVFLSGSLTTRRMHQHAITELWIAFKLYFYRVHWQLAMLYHLHSPGCELLSNCIFIGFIDNRCQVNQYFHIVVNCFQIVFLSGSLTTMNDKLFAPVVLWIAFKLYFYRVHWQQNASARSGANCCELLSNCIFIGFIDNRWRIARRYRHVVNCFQIVFLSGSLTTALSKTTEWQPLWIAFKLYFYRVHWQLLSLAT